MLRAVIVEDEFHSLEALRNLVLQYCSNTEILALADSVESGVQAIQLHQPDLVFLDIEMQTGTGFEILEKVNRLDFEVIFTTAHEHYALKAIKFSAIDYLLKPIDIEELQLAVGKVREKRQKKFQNKQLQTLLSNWQNKNNSSAYKITLATAESYEFINVVDIIYCRADGSYTRFHLKNGNELMVSKHLKEYENLLTDHDFFRIHHSFLINLSEVEKYVKSEGGYILMKNGAQVSISPSKKDRFMLLMRKKSEI